MPNYQANYYSPLQGYREGQQYAQQKQHNALALQQQQGEIDMQPTRNALAQSQATHAQQETDQFDATQAHAQIQQALQSPDVRQHIMRYEPEWVQDLADDGIDVANSDDATVRSALEGYARHVAGQAGIAPATQLETISGENGGVLQRDPTTNALKQVVAPQKADHFAEAEAGRDRRSQASIAARPTAQQGTPDNIESAANAIANYQLAPLGAFAMRSPYGQAVMARVTELNPEYQANEFGSRSKAYKEFSTGKNGNQVRSFNVAISHLSSIEKMADALDNGDVPTFNKLKNAFSRETGKAAPNTFDGMKKIVTDEIVKSIVGAGGGVADREEASNTISAAGSPAQLIGILNGYRELMAGQLHGLQQQYQTSTGRNDFDRLLSDESKQYLQQHQGAQQAPQAGTPQPGAVEGGYQFKGGNPADPNSWVKVQ